MRLKDVEVVLGTVLSNEDPAKLGRIKCGASGYFNRSKGHQSVIDMPWVYPFSMAMNQSFTVPEEGKKVWLIDNKEVDEEFWYIPFHEMTEDLKNTSGDYYGTDIVFSRNIAGKVAQIYSTNDKGIHIVFGDSEIALTAEGEAFVKTADAGITIKGGVCYAGTGTGEDGSQKAVMGENLSDLLSNMASKFAEMSTKCTSPYNLPALQPDFQALSKMINDALEELNSEHVKITK